MVVLAPLFALTLLAGTVGLVFWLMAAQTRKTETGLQALAQRLGLVLTVKKTLGLITDAELRGKVADGRALRFWSYATGSGKSRTSWVAVSVQPRTAGRLTFELQRQGLATRIMGFFGTKEITVGDAAFDAAWFVQTSQPEFFAAALVPQIRAKLMAALAGGASGRFRLTDGAVTYAEMGAFSNAIQCARLEAAVPVLQDLADVAEVAGNG